MEAVEEQIQCDSHTIVDSVMDELVHLAVVVCEYDAPTPSDTSDTLHDSGPWEYEDANVQPQEEAVVDEQEGSGDCSATTSTAVPGDAERYARAVQGSPSYGDLGRVTGAHSKLGVGDPGPAIIHRLSSCSTMRFLSPTAAPFHPSLLVDEPEPVEVEVDEPEPVEMEVDEPQPVEDVVMVPLVVSQWRCGWRKWWLRCQLIRQRRLWWRTCSSWGMVDHLAGQRG